VPIGLFIVAGTGQPQFNWIGPAIGFSVFMTGIYPIYLAVSRVLSRLHSSSHVL